LALSGVLSYNIAIINSKKVGMSEKEQEKSVKDSKFKKSQIENENLAAALCYLAVGVIWYFADEKMKKSELVKFHVKQAINLIIVSTVANAVLTFTIVGLILVFPLSVFFLIVGIIGFVSAINSEKKRIPVIGGWAEKYLKF
jgi:uncharacterized membrane protein